MAYIGRIPQVGNYFTLDAITTSSTATYNLLKGGVAYVPETAYHLIVSLNGVIQAPITAYTVSGSQIIFASTLSASDSIDFITVLGDTLAIGTPSDATVTDAKIVDVAATKLTGSIADARVPASAVTQHVTGYDDSAIRADISALALREATNETSAAFNLPNSFIDTFATDVLGTKTDVDVSNGYVTSVIPAGFASNSAALKTNLKHLYSFDNNVTDQLGNQNLVNVGGVSFNSSTKKLGTHSAYFDGGTTSTFSFDNGSGAAGVPYFHTNNTNGSYPPAALSIAFWMYWTPSNGNWNMVFDSYHSSTSGKRNYIFGTHDDSTASVHDKFAVWDGLDTNWGNSTDGGTEANTATISHSTWTHVIASLTTTKKQVFLNGTLTSHTGTFGFGSDGTGNHLRIGGRADNTAYQYKGYLDQFCIWDREVTQTDANNLYNSGSGNLWTAETISATGTAIQAANTVGSAKTEVSGTMIYKDNAGTATLGTDLKIYFTCNGGSNWTEAASYNAITPVYATGIKQVRLGKTTCTSGTDIRYKAVWANQASGSKETQLHGIGINY